MFICGSCPETIRETPPPRAPPAARRPSPSPRSGRAPYQVAGREERTSAAAPPRHPSSCPHALPKLAPHSPPQPPGRPRSASPPPSDRPLTARADTSATDVPCRTSIGDVETSASSGARRERVAADEHRHRRAPVQRCQSRVQRRLPPPTTTTRRPSRCSGALASRTTSRRRRRPVQAVPGSTPPGRPPDLAVRGRWSASTSTEARNSAPQRGDAHPRSERLPPRSARHPLGQASPLVPPRREGCPAPGGADQPADRLVCRQHDAQSVRWACRAQAIPAGPRP